MIDNSDEEYLDNPTDSLKENAWDKMIQASVLETTNSNQ